MWGSDDDDDGEEQPQQARFFFNTASSPGGLWGSHCSSAGGNGSNAGGIAPMKQLAGPPPVDIAPPDSFVAARRGAQQISPLVGFGRRAASASSSLQLQLQLKASCSDDDDELAAQGSSSGSFGAPATLGFPSPVSLSMPLGKHHVLQSGLLTASSSSTARNKASKFKTFVNLTPLSLPAANTQQHKPPGQSVPQRKQLGLARVNKAFTARPQQSHTHTNHSIQHRQQPQPTQQAQQVQNPQTLQQAQHVQKPQRLTIAASRSNTNIVTARTTTPTNSVKGRAVAVSAKQPAPAPPAAVSGKPAASSTSVVAAAAAAAALALRQQAPPKPHRSTKRRLSAATGAAAAPAVAAKKVKSTPAVAISATATPPNANVVSASSAIQQLPPFSNASSDSNHIVIVMKDHPNTTMFQITNETTFGELFEAYGRSQATATSTYSFEYKGTLLKALELSPSAFGMEDGVCIDVIAGRATRAATSSKSALQTAAKAFARAPLPTHRRPTERGSSIAAQASRQQPELKEEEEEEEEDDDDDDDEASHASSQDFATSSEEENSPRRNRYKSIIASGASAANEGSSSNSRGPAAVAADVTVHVVASGTSAAAPTPTPTPATAALRLQLIAEDGSSTEMSATPNSTWRELRKTYAEMHAPPLDVAFLMLKFKGGKIRMRNKVAETENMQDGDTIDVHDTKE